MRQIQIETGGSTVLCFINTNQILFVMFISFYLTYCIKEFIKGKILSIWNIKKVSDYETATAWNRGISWKYFFTYRSDCICFVYFSIFDILYIRGYQRQHFWTLNLRMLSNEAATDWNGRIPCKIIKSLTKWYLIFFLLYCYIQCIKKVIIGEMFLY